jgi:hypothetical protein
MSITQRVAVYVSQRTYLPKNVLAVVFADWGAWHFSNTARHVVGDL